MQIVLAGALVFALVWFAVLRPKDPAEDVAATPVTPAATTPAANAGGAAAQTGAGKIVETAKNGAAAADSAVKSSEAQTGETTPAAPATAATTPAAAAPSAAATPKPTTPAAAAGTKTGKTKVSAAQERANKVITKIQADLKKRRAVIVLVWSKTGKEDKIVYRRLQKDINRRGGKVRVYYVPVKDVGRYDGLLSGLSLGQIPSTIVIAPNNQAKVLGGLVSTARIDRLTSSATLTKPVASATK